jgi:hypothetical protein
VILAPGWVVGVTWCGGAIGVQIARRKESGNLDLHTVLAELLVRQDHFLVGLGVGFAVAIVTFVVFLWWWDRRKKLRRG